MVLVAGRLLERAYADPSTARSPENSRACRGGADRLSGRSGGLRDALAGEDCPGLVVGALVVSSDGRRIEGIVSERDVARGLHTRGAGLLGDPVSSVMTAEVHTCTSHVQLTDLARLMTDEEAELLDAEAPQACLTVDRLAYDDVGQFVEFGRHVYHAAHYSIQSSLVV